MTRLTITTTNDPSGDWWVMLHPAEDRSDLRFVSSFQDRKVANQCAKERNALHNEQCKERGQKPRVVHVVVPKPQAE